MRAAGWAPVVPRRQRLRVAAQRARRRPRRAAPARRAARRRALRAARHDRLHAIVEAVARVRRGHRAEHVRRRGQRGVRAPVPRDGSAGQRGHASPRPSTRRRSSGSGRTPRSGIHGVSGYFQYLDTERNTPLLARYRARRSGRWAPPLSSLSESVFEAIHMWAAAARAGAHDRARAGRRRDARRAATSCRAARSYWTTADTAAPPLHLAAARGATFGSMSGWLTPCQRVSAH